MSVVIFDACSLDGRLCRVDPGCDLIDYISITFDGESCGIIEQLEKLKQCVSERVVDHIIQHISISDEDLADFIMTEGPSIPALDRIAEDPYDLKILAYHKMHNAKAIITCDRRLLYAADKLGLAHSCFKAALHMADNRFDAGITADPAYNTNPMLENGNDPFFHYPNNRYCGGCDPGNQCPCHR